MKDHHIDSTQAHSQEQQHAWSFGRSATRSTPRSGTRTGPAVGGTHVTLRRVHAPQGQGPFFIAASHLRCFVLQRSQACMTVRRSTSSDFFFRLGLLFLTFAFGLGSLHRISCAFSMPEGLRRSMTAFVPCFSLLVWIWLTEGTCEGTMCSFRGRTHSSADGSPDCTCESRLTSPYGSAGDLASACSSR